MRQAGFAVYALQYPLGLIGPFTTLHVPQAFGEPLGMNCWQFEHILPGWFDAST